MRAYKTSVLAGLLALWLMGVGSDATAAEGKRGGCRRADSVRIVDLDLSPDPIVEGQRIRFWTVKIRLEGRRECDTEIEIRDSDGVVARQRNSTLRPGMNEIKIQPAERYRFHRDEHCLKVVVDLEGTRREVDADRRFCARKKASWSMGERGDRERR